jgi:hypothetical protein
VPGWRQVFDQVGPELASKARVRVITRGERGSVKTESISCQDSRGRSWPLGQKGRGCVLLLLFVFSQT